MKEKNLYCLIIWLLILFYPILTIASLNLDCKVMKAEYITTISQDYSLPNDLEVPDLNAGSSEIRIRIVTYQINLPIKTVTCSRFIKIHFFNKNIQNQISTLITRGFIPYHHYSILFTGVLLI